MNKLISTASAPDALASRSETTREAVATGAPQVAARWPGRVIFVLLLALIVLTAIPYGTVEEWSKGVFVCAVLGLCALWMVEGLLSGKWLVRDHALLVPLIGFALFAVLQTIPFGEISQVAGVRLQRTLSADPYETRLTAFRFLALVLLAALLLRYMASPRRLQTLVHVVIGVGVASAIFGIARQTMQQPYMTGFGLPHLSYRVGYGQFINDNHSAFLMELVLGLTLGLVVGRGVPRSRALVYLAAAAVMWTALLQSTSRGGIFGMTSQIIFLAIAWLSFGGLSIEQPRWGDGGVANLLHRAARSVVVRVALIIGLIVAVGIGIVWVGGEQVVNRLEAVPTELQARDEQRSNTRRREIWQATWQLIKDHPVAGVGFGGYWVAIPAYHDASGELTPRQAHNDYLELVASGGVIGAGLGIWFLIVFIKRARVRLGSPDPFRRAAGLGAVAGIFAGAVHSFVDFGLHITINAVILTALAVIATTDERIEEASDTHGKSLAKSEDAPTSPMGDKQKG